MKLTITYCFVCFIATMSLADKAGVQGMIDNYSNQPLYLYQCYGDTVLLADSTHTNEIGEFSFAGASFSKAVTLARDTRSVALKQVGSWKEAQGLYKVVLQSNQFFYLIYEGSPVEIRTTYFSSPFYNVATDSLLVITSDINREFYEFQSLQQPLNIANHWLLQMMRLYPLPDPFHPQLEKEYLARYEAMDKFMEGTKNEVALAYYRPVNPDWKQSDPWRDSIIADHYFDYFNPADPFYLHTNILPDKMDVYLALRTNKRDSYGQPINDERLFSSAAEDFVKATLSNDEVYKFCLNYLLKMFRKGHQDIAFLELHDAFLKTSEGDCGLQEKDALSWARQKASVLRGVQIGSIAPDFEIIEGKMNLHSLNSEYTLLLFWASWCPHCTQILPEIKKAVENFTPLSEEGGKVGLVTVAVSLDTSRTEWQACVENNNLSTWLNFSELQGWKGEISKRYNVYATPTMLLLDKNKQIIANHGSIKALIRELKEM